MEVLNPFGAADGSATSWLSSYKDDVARYLARRMPLGDAVLAREADRYQAGGNRHLERQRLRGTDGSAGLDARTILEAFCLGHKFRFYARKPSRKLQ